MRSPLRTKAGRYSRVSVSVSLPSPTGGWNTRDALQDMKPNYAVQLDNWWTNTTFCEVRGGMSSHATGMTGNGKTLAVYNAMDGTNKMFCLTSSGTYDVSASGAVGASSAARTNGKHQWVNFGDGTNHYLILANGVDKPLYYNGTTWTAVDAASTPALTGLTTTSIVSVFVFKGRLIFIEKDSLSFWYLPSGAAGGVLTEFDLSRVARHGGYIMAGSAWTFDGGSGPDDRCVFITSEGEAIVYQGTNPGSASEWALVGIYDIGKPLGRRCMNKYGGDLVVLTQSGIYPLSQALQSASVSDRTAITDIINSAFSDSARSYGSAFGWEITFHPVRNCMIVNVPIAEDGTHHQYCMNIITKAWCRFIGWDAETFAVYNNNLYYADGTAVYKAWTGTSDNGVGVNAYGKCAFSYLNNNGVQKRVAMFKPVLSVDGSIDYLTGIDIDFKDAEITGAASYQSSSGSLWDTALWDVNTWGGGMEIVNKWTSPRANIGYAVSGKLKVQTVYRVIQWMACEYIYETGGPL